MSDRRTIQNPGNAATVEYYFADSAWPSSFVAAGWVQAIAIKQSEGIPEHSSAPGPAHRSSKRRQPAPTSVAHWNMGR
jgi:hypothetical protein